MSSAGRGAASWAWLGALAGALAGCALFAPASWLAGALAWASADRVQLAQPHGTVWNGNARLVLSGGALSRDARVLPGRVHWRLQWRGSALHLQLQADCCTTLPLQLSAVAHWGGWSLRVVDGSSQWPAAVLAGLGSPWNTLQVQGRLVLASRALSLEWFEGRTSMQGSATLDALDLSSKLSTLSPIGSYRLRLAGNGQQSPPQLQLSTLRGSLKLTGQGQWNGSRWAFRGQASASAEDELVLGNLLNIVGRRQGGTSVIALD